MEAGDDRCRAIDPNHVEYFASAAVPMTPPHIQTIRPFVFGRRKGDGQRVCPTDQRRDTVAVFATDAFRLHQLQRQPPQRQCFSIRCHGRKTFALFAAETSRKRSHTTQQLGTAHANNGYTTSASSVRLVSSPAFRLQALNTQTSCRVSELPCSIGLSWVPSHC
jgi:hypothetical protein